MKKLLTALLAAALIISCVGCGNRSTKERKRGIESAIKGIQ